MNIQKLTLLSALTLLFACTQQPAGISISGSIENPKEDTVAFRITNQDTILYATLDASNQFHIDFKMDSASYVSFIHGQESTALYLLGDEQLTLSLNTEAFDESIEYTGSPASSYLAKKYLMEEATDFWRKQYSTPWLDFKILLDDHNDALTQELSQLTNEGFIALEKDIMQQMDEYFERTITTFSQLPQPGEEAIDFTYEDRNGKAYSLSDFKGELVYIDVWATWCGPCVREIPFMQTLEEEYHGKELTFLSISVDENREAWETMLAEKEMGGTQLIAENGWSSKIMQDYAINGIPRFMLFDKAGNVISLMAPRPSSEEIRTLINENL